MPGFHYVTSGKREGCGLCNPAQEISVALREGKTENLFDLPPEVTGEGNPMESVFGLCDPIALSDFDRCV